MDTKRMEAANLARELRGQAVTYREIVKILDSKGYRSNNDTPFSMGTLPGLMRYGVTPRRRRRKVNAAVVAAASVNVDGMSLLKAIRKCNLADGHKHRLSNLVLDSQ